MNLSEVKSGQVFTFCRENINFNSNWQEYKSYFIKYNNLFLSLFGEENLVSGNLFEPLERCSSCKFGLRMIARKCSLRQHYEQFARNI